MTRGIGTPLLGDINKQFNIISLLGMKLINANSLMLVYNSDTVYSSFVSGYSIIQMDVKIQRHILQQL